MFYINPLKESRSVLDLALEDCYDPELNEENTCVEFPDVLPVDFPEDCIESIVGKVSYYLNVVMIRFNKDYLIVTLIQPR
jgi:hypothetical protein